MLQILNIVMPIYILIGTGYAMTRSGLFKKEDMRVLGKFVLHLALPALIIRSLATNAINDVFYWPYLAAYFGGTALMIGLGYVWCLAVARQDRLTATFQVIGMSCSNSGFVGYPILLLVLPASAGHALALNMLVENLLIIPFLLFMAESARDSQAGWRSLFQSLYRLRSNPVIIGITGGLLLSVFKVAIPSFVIRSVDLFASASSATSLVVIGGSLVGISLKNELSQTLPVLLGKLVLHPLFVFAAVSLLEQAGSFVFEPVYKLAIVIMAATPIMGIYPTLAQTYGRASTSALNMLLATVLSFFTLSALLLLMKTSLGF